MACNTDGSVVLNAACEGVDISINTESTLVVDLGVVVGSAVIVVGTEREFAAFCNIIRGAILVVHGGCSRTACGNRDAAAVRSVELSFFTADSDLTCRTVVDRDIDLVASDIKFTVVVSTADGDSIAVGVEFTSGIVLQLGNGDRTISVDSSFIGDLCGSAGRIFAEGKDACVVIGTVSFDSFVEDQLTVIGDLNTAAVVESSVDSNSSVIDDLNRSASTQSQVVVGTQDDVLTACTVTVVFNIDDIVEDCGSSGGNIAAKDHGSGIGTGESSGALQHIAGNCQIVVSIADHNSTVVGQVGGKCRNSDGNAAVGNKLTANIGIEFCLTVNDKRTGVGESGIDFNAGTLDHVVAAVIDSTVDSGVGIDKTAVAELLEGVGTAFGNSHCTFGTVDKLAGEVGVAAESNRTALNINAAGKTQSSGIVECQLTAGNPEAAVVGCAGNQQHTATHDLVLGSHTEIGKFGTICLIPSGIDHDPGRFIRLQHGVVRIIPDGIINENSIILDIALDGLAEDLGSGFDIFEEETMFAVGDSGGLVIGVDTVAFTVNNEVCPLFVVHSVEMQS